MGDTRTFVSVNKVKAIWISPVLERMSLEAQVSPALFIVAVVFPESFRVILWRGMKHCVRKVSYLKILLKFTAEKQTIDCRCAFPC